MSYPEEGINTEMLCFKIIFINRSKKRESSASGIISLSSDMKNPADIGLESDATIFPAKLANRSDLIVFMPAGPSAPGTKTVNFPFLSKELIRNLGHTLDYYL